jgi:cyclic pyranopterin phosphate synthase
LALVTNGWALRDEVVPLLMRAKWVRVSVDAGCAETFSQMREVPLSSFGKVWANVQRLCAARDAAGSDTIIGVGFVVTKENWREVGIATLMAKMNGADNIRLSAVFQPDDEAYFADFHTQAAALCREAESHTGDGFRVFNNFGDRLADLKEHSPDYSFCGYQHFSTYIGADLNVYRCCVQSYNPRGLVGSLKAQTFAELWASEDKRANYAAFDATGCERCMFNEKNRTINYALATEPAHVNFV